MEYNQRAIACVDLRDADPRNYWIHSSFDPDLIQLACTVLGGHGVVWDVGANFGLFSFGLIPFIDGRSRLDLFEANPQLQGALQGSRTLQSNSERIYIHPHGVGKSGGKLHFQVDLKNLGASHVSETGGVEISMISLDQFAAGAGIAAVDFMKLDVEGHEYEVLEGASSLLKDQKIRVIHCEVSQENQRRAGRSVTDLLRLMETYRYRPFFYKKEDFILFPGNKVLKKFPGGEMQLLEVLSFGNIVQTDLLFLPEEENEKGSSAA